MFLVFLHIRARNVRKAMKLTVTAGMEIFMTFFALMASSIAIAAIMVMKLPIPVAIESFITIAVVIVM